MKLVKVTAVKSFHKDVIKLFKKSGIENFSESEIDGYKNGPSVLLSTNWFGTVHKGNESSMFFSFTDDIHIDELFVAIKKFNEHLKESNNPLKAIVVPIEKYI